MAIASNRVSPPGSLGGFLVLFIASHVVSAVTGSFGVLFASRIVGALADADFLAVPLSTVHVIVLSSWRDRGPRSGRRSSALPDLRSFLSHHWRGPGRDRRHDDRRKRPSN